MTNNEIRLKLYAAIIIIIQLMLTIFSLLIKFQHFYCGIAKLFAYLGKKQ